VIGRTLLFRFAPRDGQSTLMKTPRFSFIFILTFCALLIAGCQASGIEQTRRNYRSVAPGMSEVELITLLGPPTHRARDFTRWERRSGPDNNYETTTLDVVFDRDGRVLSKKIKVAHHDAKSSVDFPNFPKNP
jgi:hypothetical protein